MTAETKVARGDILRIIDALAAEKHIDRERVFLAVEEAVQKAARSNFGADMDIRAHVNRRNGQITLARYKLVVEEVENPLTEITLKEAVDLDAEIGLGQEITEELPMFDFGRLAALNGRQMISQQMREAEREQQYLYYQDRVGTVTNGIVKREEYGNVVLELDHQAEAYMKREQRIPRENIKDGEGFERSRRVRVYITDVVRDNRGPQILVSRTHPQFLIALFRQEVPEIYDNTVEIKAVARDPGSRAKMAVISHDTSIDPVGACVGIRGIRVRPIVEELQGEKIDIIPWDDNIAHLAVNALAPAEVSQVIVDEEMRRLEMVVEESQLSLAIGRKGQNVRLASQLTGWSIDILTEEQLQTRSQEENKALCEKFMSTLDVEEIIAQYLIAEGFSSVEEISYVDIEELKAIEGFGDFAEELQQRAKTYLEQQAQQELETLDRLGVTEDLRNFDRMLSFSLLTKLGEARICSLDDLAGCARDDLIGEEDTPWEGESITEKAVNSLILKARTTLGWIESEPVAPQADDSADGEVSLEGEATAPQETELPEATPQDTPSDLAGEPQGKSE